MPSTDLLLWTLRALKYLISLLSVTLCRNEVQARLPTDGTLASIPPMIAICRENRKGEVSENASIKAREA